MRKRGFFGEINLSWKIGFIFGVVVFIFFAAGGYYTYSKLSRGTRENLGKSLTVLAQSIAATVNVAEHETIVSPADEFGATYEKMVTHLKKIADASLEIDSIYTLRWRGQGNMGFFVLDIEDIAPADSEESGRAHFGEEYDMSEYPDMVAAFFGKAGADKDIACDKWGCWMSGYAPLKNARGETVAILGVDFSAEAVMEREREIRQALPVLVFLFFLFVVFIIFLIKGFFLRPLSIIGEGIENFSKDLSVRIDLKTGDEFEKIADKFNEMAGQVTMTQADLEKMVKERTRQLAESNDKLEESNLKLKKADEMRKNFVSHTAHELRTPLNALRWSLELLRNEDLGKINLEQRELVNDLYVSSERLLSLVSDLLEVARIDEARFKIQSAPCRIEEIIDEVAGNLAVEIRKKNFNFIWEKPVPPALKILADKDKIFQAVLNILNNALKFSRPGGEIKIAISQTDKIAPRKILEKFGFSGKSKKYILVSIADQGIGIPEKEQEKIFDRFFRASNVKNTNIPGTGLGLFIVAEIIKLHGGAVWFESEENKGTKFFFTLPVA